MVEKEADIAIPKDKIGEFFFLDSEEEEAHYGHKNDYQKAAELAKALTKNKSKNNPGLKFKQVIDFKVRVLDFLAIYVKKNGYKSDPSTQIKLIRGLLKGLSTAHKDQSKALFDRLKSVLALMAKQGSSQDGKV